MIPPATPASPIPHPWPSGHTFSSPGAHFTYRVVGPCCRLFDREQLPWPCCRLQWRGKEPSWRRIGRRFVVDMATRRVPSYCVEILGQGYHSQPFVTTLYPDPLDEATRQWWHTPPKAPLATTGPRPGIGPAQAVPEPTDKIAVDSAVDS